MAFKVFWASSQPLTVEMDLGALGPLNEIFGSQLDLDLLPQSEESHFWQKNFFFSNLSLSYASRGVLPSGPKKSKCAQKIFEFITSIR